MARLDAGLDRVAFNLVFDATYATIVVRRALAGWNPDGLTDGGSA
jgi:hypothetical protein